MALTTGSLAPDFNVKDIYGNEVSVSQYRGKKNLLIFFSRYIGCSWCQMFIADIKRNREELEKRETEVIVITESEEAVLRKYAPEKEKSFLIMVSDPNKRLYELYGVKKHGNWFSGKVIVNSFKFLKYLRDYKYVKDSLKGDPLQAPACFVVGKDGRIKFTFVSESIADHPDIDEIMKLLEK